MFDTQPTPLDLNFRVGPFPVRVQPWFFVGMLFLGWSFAGAGLLVLLTWVLCGFVSILWHELGHSVAGRSFGRPSRIHLIAFGGFAEFYDGQPPAGWRRLVMVMGGPAAGFLLAGLVYVSNESTGWGGRDSHFLLQAACLFLFWQNLGWSLFNLLPLWPLDGGRALREILYIVGLRRPDVPTHWAGMAGAVTLAVLGVVAATSPENPLVQNVPFVRSGFLCILLFGIIAFQNWQALQLHARAGRYHDPAEDDENDRKWRGYR